MPLRSSRAIEFSFTKVIFMTFCGLLVIDLQIVDNSDVFDQIQAFTISGIKYSQIIP